MNKQIERYNETVDDVYCIYEMSHLDDLLYELGYDNDDIMNIYDLDEIDPANFDKHDEYVWLSKENGYIYSGDLNCALAVASIDSGDEQDLKPGSTLHRLEVELDGKYLGFAAAIGELLESGDLAEDDKEVQKLNALLSNMRTPLIKDLSSDRKCWFTEAGIEHFSCLISEIKKLFESLDIPVVERTMTLDNPKAATSVDAYQVIAKLRRLIKKS